MRHSARPKSRRATLPNTGNSFGEKFSKEAAVNKTLGMILIALGLFGLAWGGFTYTGACQAL